MKKYIFPVLIAVLMVIVFCFSAQPADDSEMTSSHFCLMAAKLLFGDYETWDSVMQEKVVEGLTFVVRKAAHFSEYALMGALWYLWLQGKRYNIPIAFAATAGYAVTDEFHQRFVPGRSCEFRDVLIDSAGAFTGIIAAFVILCVLYCIRHHEVVRWGVWKKDT